MPLVTGTQTEDSGSIRTYYTGTVTATTQTFNFSGTQDSMNFVNKGDSVVNITVNGVITNVPPFASVEINDNELLSFDVIRASAGSNQFDLVAIQLLNDVADIDRLGNGVGYTKTEVDGMVDGINSDIADVNTQLAENVSLVSSFGADKSGLTDTSTAVTNAFASLEATKGGTLKFPSGLYNIAVNGRIEINGKKNIVIDGDLFTKIFNNTKCGSTGDMLVFINCENILIRNIEFGCPSGNANAYDNALVFLGCKNVKLEKCRFTKTSNKHIHIGGITENIEIENCYFEEAHVNSNPTLSTQNFSSIFLHYESEVLTKITNIKINKCTFKNIPLIAISVTNFDTRQGGAKEDAITDIDIKDNTFINCGIPFYTRGKRINVEGNRVIQCGYKNIQTYYVWDSTTSRYFSKQRQTAGQTPTASNTIPQMKLALIYNLSGMYNSFKRNKFVNCLDWQVNSDDPITNSMYMEGRLSKHCEVKDNVFDDEKSTAYPNAYGLWFGNTGEDTKFNEVENNKFILNPSVVPVSKQMIRFDVTVNTVKGNKLYNAPVNFLYQSTLNNEKAIIYRNSKYYELNIDGTTGSVTATEKIIGTDF